MSHAEKPNTPRKILAIASGGGHWHQLQILGLAFDNCDVSYATTLDGLAEQSGLKNVALVTDCNANEKLNIVRSIYSITRLLISEKPEIIVSTGALPGLLALAIGKLMGKRTLWIDSVANAEEYSNAGRYARFVADTRLSQWPAVVDKEGGEFAGNLL